MENWLIKVWMGIERKEMNKFCVTSNGITKNIFKFFKDKLLLASTWAFVLQMMGENVRIVVLDEW